MWRNVQQACLAGTNRTEFDTNYYQKEATLKILYWAFPHGLMVNELDLLD